MRVLVTGASGFIGSAVVAELLAHGHHVTGLARSDASARAIAALGAEVHRGALDDHASLRAGAAAADAVAHLAFDHDFSKPREVVAELDARAIAALGEGLRDGGALAIASGMVVPRTGDVLVETDAADPARPRGASEGIALGLAARGIRSAVVRLPPTVHGRGDQAFVPHLIRSARAHGVSVYIGDGANRWPAVHRLDAARLFRLALERAPAGSRLHAVDDGGLPTRTIAETIAARLGVPARSVTAAEAPTYLGFLATFFAADAAASSALTRARVDWAPTHPNLLADLADDHYFTAST